MISIETTMTLGRAQKLLQGLEAFLAKYRTSRRRPAWALDGTGEEFRGVIDETLSAQALLVNSDQIASNLRRKGEITMRQVEEYFIVAADRASLKESLFRRNLESGVSTLLTRRDLLKDEIDRLTTLLNSLEDVRSDALPLTDVSGERLRALVPSESGERPQVAITVQLFDAQEIRSRLEERRVEMARVEDELRAKNATEQVAVHLHEVSARHLGIK